MENFIPFDKSISDPIHFGLTAGAVQKAREIGIEKKWFMELTRCKRFLLSMYMVEKNGEHKEHFCFHYRKIVLDCILNSDQNDSSSKHFLIIAIRRADYTRWSEAVGHGKSFYFANNVSLSFHSKENGFHFYNGSEYSRPQNVGNSEPAAKIIKSCFQDFVDVLVVDETYEPSEELTEYLNLAQNYAEVAYNLEQLAVNDTPPLVYHEIMGANHENITGTTLRFILQSLNEKKYPDETKVEIKKNQDQSWRGTIVKLAPLENPPWVDIQFNHQTNLDDLPQSGLITLACSSVNHDVQSAAIEGLRLGTAKAQYMDDILGKATPKTFISAPLPPELIELNKQLDQKEYPLNPSQKNAIFNGILAKDAYLVMGPPGTGKTTVILEWVRYFVQERHMRVLVSSQNNMAVDNVLERIMQEDGIDVLRIGSESKVASPVLPCLFENKLQFLRNQIDTTTADNVDKLQKCIQCWEAGIQVFGAYREPKHPLDDLDGLVSAIQSAVECFKSIRETVSDYLGVEENMSNMTQDMLMLIDQEQNYRNCNRLVRFLLSPVSKARLKKIRCAISDFFVYAEKAIRRSRHIVAQIVEWRQTVLETENHALKDLVLDSVNLVGATCIGIKSQKRFADLQYDVTIIDEAGQIQIHNALVPMSVSNKLIMLGDHKQIPPMVEEKMLEPLNEHEITTKLLEKSLFEDLYERFPDTNKSMLDTQFRMPSEIAKILSDWFYEGKYKSHPSKENITGELKYLSAKPFVIVDTFDDPYRYESSVISQGEGNKAHVNKLEADIIADIVSILYHSDYDMSKIGAIAALKAQVALIHRKMIERGIPKDLVSDIVATLDSYQGQERDIILYSFVRSSQRETDKTGVGFLTELRRLNVAMSRCKRTLVMVGDMTFLSTRDAIVNYRGEAIDLEQDWVKTERHFAQFIRHILQYVNDGAGERMNIATYRTRLQNWRHHAQKEE